MECADDLLPQNLRSGDNAANVRTSENKTPASPRGVAYLHQRQMETSVYDEPTNLSARNCAMSTTRLTQETRELTSAECSHGSVNMAYRSRSTAERDAGRCSVGRSVRILFSWFDPVSTVQLRIREVIQIADRF